MSTEPETIEGETTDYIVHVVTGTKPGAGTDANVFISIIGICHYFIFIPLKIEAIVQINVIHKL